MFYNNGVNRPIMNAPTKLIWDFSLVLARRLMLWAGLSVIAGFILVATQIPQGWTTTFWGGFGSQAILWGAIDGIIAAFGIYGTRRSIRRAGEGDEAAATAAAKKDAQRLRRLLWINTGLDLLYVAGGLAWALTRGADDPFAAGVGWGIVVQGAFLFIFDLLHARAIPLEEPAPLELNLFQGPEHQPFTWEAGRPAAVLMHGFGGTPAEMRDLGHKLHDAGWTVQGVLLPGFGPDITSLPERSYLEWVATAEDAVKGLKATGHAPVMLVGYSLGSAVSLAAAGQVQVDGLALVAPFWWRERGWMRVLGAAIRPFLPSNFRPLNKANFDDPRFREGLSKFLPGTDLDDPEAREGLRNLRFPLDVIEQIREVSVVAFASASHVGEPVLMVQGLTDPVVRIPATKKLAGQFPNGVSYTEVDGGHDIVQADKPTWDAVSQAVMTFAETLQPT